MKTTFAATAALLSATSYASTVTLETTKCPSSDIPTEQFEVELNTQEAVPLFLSQICGLKIVSASSDFFLKDIQCQAFKDIKGTVPGSAVFTYDEPAQIATNPVAEQAIHCIVNVTPDETLERRQLPTATNDVFTTVDPTEVLPSGLPELTGTPSPRPAASSSATDEDESSTASSGATASDASDEITRSTVFITSTASRTGPSGFVTATGATTIDPSSGFPSSTNGTALSTSRPTPTQSTTPAPSGTNAAGQAAVGLGVVAAAFAALVL